MADRADADRDVLLVSTADWDNPFWTNKQHVAVELARAGRRVLYVDSAGLRRPSLGDVRRIVRRLRRSLAPPRQVRPGLWVWSPTTLPLQGLRAVRRLNRILLRLGLRRALASTGLQPGVLWTYSPLTLELYDCDQFSRLLYHAVDDIAAQPGMPSAAIRAAEAKLVRRADLVFATSPSLHARHVAAGARRCILHANAVDFGHFSPLAGPRSPPADLLALPPPRIGFVGAVSAYKLDVELLRGVAQARPGYSFVLIGQAGEGDPWSDLAPLSGLPNLHLMGPRAYARLPDYMAGFDVGLLPCPNTPYTTAMFPMKFFEYLAAGLPVVSTPLPALEAYADLAVFAPPEPQAFAAALDRALDGAAASLPLRLEAARSQTYARRTAAMLAELDGLRRP